MIHFSKNTLKNAKLVFQVKDQLKEVLAEHNFNEVDLLNFADEFTASIDRTVDKVSFEVTHWFSQN